MIYRIIHQTDYTYNHPIGVCYNILKLRPRSLPFQKVHAFHLSLSPLPIEQREENDFFGNVMHTCMIHSPHTHLTIKTQSIVEVMFSPYAFPLISWENYKMEIERLPAYERYDVLSMSLASPLIPLHSKALEPFIQEIMTSRDDLYHVIQNLLSLMTNHFEFQAGITTVSTPLEEILRVRKGVCQDFAHVTIAILRRLGLCARYVSGYIRTYPPEGQPRLVGVDASHAWVSLYVPTRGWIDIDPTNNRFVNDDYVVVAYGRDYSDITPIKGVWTGQGWTSLHVSVDMAPIDEENKGDL